jgi:hypothetical protein
LALTEKLSPNCHLKFVDRLIDVVDRPWADLEGQLGVTFFNVKTFGPRGCKNLGNQKRKL